MYIYRSVCRKHFYIYIASLPAFAQLSNISEKTTPYLSNVFLENGENIDEGTGQYTFARTDTVYSEIGMVDIYVRIYTTI